MKRTLLLAVCTTALSFSTSQSLAADNGSGCGVGQILFKGDDGLVAHTSAGTTNQWLGQPFAITSGTSGCDATRSVQRSDDKNIFVASNIDTLSQEIAQGQGDYLTTLATVFGIGKKDQATFTTSLQSEYNTIFPSHNTTSTNVVAAIDGIMQNTPNLAKYTR